MKMHESKHFTDSLCKRNAKFWRLLIRWPLFEISQSVAQVSCARDSQMSFDMFSIKKPDPVTYLFVA